MIETIFHTFLGSSKSFIAGFAFVSTASVIFKKKKKVRNMQSGRNSAVHIGLPRPRPNTTPHPTSISRVVRGLGSSSSSLGRVSALEKLPELEKSPTPDDSVVMDEVEEEVVESCFTPPKAQKVGASSSSSCAHATNGSRSSTVSSSNGGGTPKVAPPAVTTSIGGGAQKPANKPATPERQRPSTALSKPRVNLAQKALIGRGSFGVVYQAMDRDTNHIIAVKEVILPKGTAMNDQLPLIRKEIALLKQLDHPNIVKCLGEDYDDKSLRIYMEYVTGGSISNILRIFGPLSEKQTSIFAKQMLLGLRYLHSRNICHRDLKGDNLLVDTKGNLKLADFGTARELASQATSVAGTSYFMAPEVIRGTGHGLEADVWSCGCCIVEMLTGKPPFSHLNNQYAVMMHVADSASELEAIPKNISSSCKSFLERCFVRLPQKRATVLELLEHEWILRPPDTLDGDDEQPPQILSPSTIRRVQMDTLDRARNAAASQLSATDSINPLASFNDTV